MFEFFKKKNKNVNGNTKKKGRESPEIVKARKWIKSVHGEREFHYMKTSEKGEFFLRRS